MQEEKPSLQQKMEEGKQEKLPEQQRGACGASSSLTARTSSSTSAGRRTGSTRTGRDGTRSGRPRRGSGRPAGYAMTTETRGKRILIEGANATMLDIDFASSKSSAGSVLTGLDVSPKKIDVPWSPRGSPPGPLSRALRPPRAYSSPPPLRERIVVAVGGNALQRRGERLTIENMLKAAADMAPTIASLAREHELVLTHGNGPQVGELALERSAATFDVLGAESMGQIGYVLAQALASVGCASAPIICQVVVDPSDEAFRDPSKFVGPIYGAKEATALAQSLGWAMKPDGEYFRRVVPSPPPMEILQVEAIRTLLEESPSILPIACGGGGIPVSRIPSNPRTLAGVEAVIDKDRCGAKLANELGADGFIILTDGGGIWQNFGKPDAREMKRASPEYLLGTKAGKNFPGSMGPKIQAAIDFVHNSGREGAWAAIGDLKDAGKIFGNEEGTIVCEDVEEGVIWREPRAAGVAGAPRQSKEPHKSG